MHKGELILKRIKDDEVIDNFYYEQFSLNVEEKKRVKTEFLDTNEYKLICNCKNQVEMGIYSNFKGIYPKKNHTEHYNGCPRSNRYSIYNAAWKVDEATGETSVKVDFSLSPNKTDKKHAEGNELDVVPGNKKVYPRNNFQADGKVTFSAFVKNLNAQTWKKRAYRKLSFADKFEFWKTVCYGESKYINLNATAIVNKEKTKNLRKMLFEPHKAKEVQGKETRFAYMYLSGLKDLNNGNFELTCVYQTANGKVLSYNFIVKYNEFYEALDSSNLNVDTILDTDIIVSGFVFRNKYGRIEFFKLAMIKCSKYGLFSESKPEADFYSMLSDGGKIFFKPNKPMSGYENYIPDAVLLEPGTSKEVFVEVFGFNSEEYRRVREEKIKLVTEKLNETHHLIYWDALDGKQMPKIEDINSELNSLK